MSRPLRGPELEIDRVPRLILRRIHGQGRLEMGLLRDGDEVVLVPFEAEVVARPQVGRVFLAEAPFDLDE